MAAWLDTFCTCAISVCCCCICLLFCVVFACTPLSRELVEDVFNASAPKRLVFALSPFKVEDMPASNVFDVTMYVWTEFIDALMEFVESFRADMELLRLAMLPCSII